MTKIGMRRSGCEDEIIIRDTPAFAQQNCMIAEIDAGYLRHEDLGVALALENRSHRPRNISWRECPGGDLIEQRLKTMMVQPIDDREPDGRPRQRLCGFQSAETGADNNDARYLGGASAVSQRTRRRRRVYVPCQYIHATIPAPSATVYAISSHAAPKL